MNQAKKEENFDNRDITLKELINKIGKLWSHLLSKFIIILIFGIIGGAIGFIYAYNKKPIYNAELSFALEDDKSGSGISAAAGLASQFGFDLGGSGGGAFSGDNLLELMRSRSMIEKALLTPVNINGQQITLAEFYIRFNNIRQVWNDPKLKNINYLPGAKRESFTLQQDSILGVFYKEIVTNTLSVDKVDKKLSIINIKVQSINELFSKYFVEVIAKTVSDFYVETKTKKSVQNVNLLKYQRDSVRADLNANISGIANSLDAVPNQNPSRQILRTPSQHRQIDVQIDQAILTELVKNLEISQVSLRKETPLIQIIDTPILPLDVVRFGKIKGIVLGGFISIFLVVILLSLKFFFKNINSGSY